MNNIIKIPGINEETNVITIDWIDAKKNSQPDIYLISNRLQNSMEFGSACQKLA